MKNHLTLSLILLSLFSCGKDTVEKKDPGFSFGNPLSANRPLTAAEMAVGKEACVLLRDKREYFETRQDNREEFDFKAKEQVCGRSPVSLGNFSARLRVPTRGPLHFDSNFSTYIDEILTDKNGFFSHYCDRLLVDDPTDLILVVGGKRVEVKINKVGTKIKLESAWFYPDDQGAFKAYVMDGAIIHTKESTRQRKYYGVTTTRAQAYPCTNGSAKFVEQELR